MRYSVIDISSSGISYIVADTADDGSSAEIILKDRIYLGLSFFMDGNILTDEGIYKLCDCLKNVRDICAHIGVRRCVVVSTASLRNITNSEEAESEIFGRLGLYVNYIDGETEAYCDYVANVFYAGMDSPVVIDIGGKSIEICDLGKADKDEMTCLEFGLLDLRGRFVSGDNPTPDEAEEIKKFVRAKFDGAKLPGEGVYRTAVLAGATCGAIYDVYQAFSKNQPKNGPKVMDRKTFKKMTRYLISDNGRSRLMLSVAPERLALIIPACIVLRNLFKRFDVETIIVSDRGVKEGYLSMLLGGAGDVMVNEIGEGAGAASEDAGTVQPVTAPATETEDASGPDEAGNGAAEATETEETPEADTAETWPQDADAEETAWTEEIPETPQAGATETEETSEADTAETWPRDADAEETEWAEEIPEAPLQESSDETRETAAEETAVKRGRGRPRKYPVVTGDGQDGAAAVKRGRGRPRKNLDEIPVKVGTGKRGRPRKYPLADAAPEAAGESPAYSEPEDADAAVASEEWYADENEEGIAATGYGSADTANDGIPVPADDEALAVDETREDAGYDDAGYDDEYDGAGYDDTERDGAEYEDEGYDGAEYGSAVATSVAAEEEDADMPAEDAEPVAAGAPGGVIEPEEETSAPVGRGSGSVQVTMDDFVADDEGYESEEAFENELDEPVGGFGAGEEATASDAEASVDAGDAGAGTAEEAASGDVAVRGGEPGPVRPAGTGKPRVRGAGKAPAKKGASKGRTTAKKKTASGSAGMTAVGNAKSGSGRRPAAESGSAPAERPVEAPAETPADVPVAPVYAPGPGEEILSDRIPERRVAPYVDAYDDSTDESGSFSDFVPVDVAEAEDVDNAPFDGPEEDVGSGLSGMTDMDEDFSPFSGADADFVDKVDEDE